MAIERDGGVLRIRGGGGCVAWMFLPTVLIGAGLLLAVALQVARRFGVWELGHTASWPVTLALFAGAAVCLLGGSFGLTGRTLVELDPAAREVRISLWSIWLRHTKRHRFEDYEEVAILSGRTRHSMFWFPSIRGRSKLALPRSDLEHARALGLEVATMIGIPLVEPESDSYPQA